MTISFPLYDGSECQVTATGPSSSLVSRHVEGTPVWADEVAGPNYEKHIEAMVAAMSRQPALFVRFGDSPFRLFGPSISIRSPGHHES